MLNEEKYTLTLKRREICNLKMAITSIILGTKKMIEEDKKNGLNDGFHEGTLKKWIDLHTKLNDQLTEQDEALEKERSLQIRKTYENIGGGKYKVIKVCKEKECYWVRSEAGWITKVHGAKKNEEEKIDWEYSTNGHWEGDDLDD